MPSAIVHGMWVVTRYTGSSSAQNTVLPAQHRWRVLVDDHRADAHGRLDEEAAALTRLGTAVAGTGCRRRRPRRPREPLTVARPAEAEGFEPPTRLGALAFKASAFGRSATLPPGSLAAPPRHADA